MRTILKIIIGCLLCYSGFAQTTRSIIDINNVSVSIDSLNAKKTLVIILPLQKDTAVINQLLRFQNRYGQKIKVVGLVTVPVNYTVDTLKNIYSSVASSGVIITPGFEPADTSLTEREAMLKWLSEKNDNRDKELFVTGSKYFLGEDGRLYAQLGSERHLDDQIIKNIVNTTLPQRFFNSQPKDTTTPVIKTDSTQQHF